MGRSDRGERIPACVCGMDWCLALRKQPGACPVSVRFPRGSKAASMERREAWLDALKIVGDEVRDAFIRFQRPAHMTTPLMQRSG